MIKWNTIRNLRKLGDFFPEEREDWVLREEAEQYLHELEFKIAQEEWRHEPELVKALSESEKSRIEYKYHIAELEAKIERVKEAIRSFDKQAECWSTTQEERDVVNLFRKALGQNNGNL